MAHIPARVRERFSSSLKRFQPIVQAAKSRDVNESDTVIVVTDMLSELFGYDKYSELTSELAIRGTFCDLATKIDGEIQCLIEVKAAGMDLKDNHTKQAADYAANQGIDWVALTNGSQWKVYKIGFGKPISHDLVIDFDLLLLSHKKDQDVETLFLLAKEGFQKSALGDYNAQREALSRFCIGAMLQTDNVLDVIRRELKRMSPDIRIDNEQIRAVLLQDVLKRDVVEGEKAEEAAKKVSRAVNKALKAKAAAASSESSEQSSEAKSQGG